MQRRQGTWENRDNVSKMALFETVPTLYSRVDTNTFRDMSCETFQVNRNINLLPIALLELFPTFFSHFRSIRQSSPKQRHSSCQLLISPPSGTAQVGTEQIGASQVSTFRVGGTFQVGNGQVGTFQVGKPQFDDWINLLT